MSRTATYHTTVKWTGEHWGHLSMGNGPEMKFSAPPDAQGHADVAVPRLRDRVAQPHDARSEVDLVESRHTASVALHWY